jgi:hypothetical protein
MGLPATTYLVNGGGVCALANYTSGYLTTTLATTGQFSLTISAISAQLSADPPMALGGQTATSTIVAAIHDQLGNPVPGGTMVELSASEGTFPNGRATFTVTTNSEGQAAAVLTLTPNTDPVEIIASVERITGSTSIQAIHPAIEVSVTPDRPIIYKGEGVTCTYEVANTGDITLADVTLVDGAGTLCEDVVLAPGAVQAYNRTLTLHETTAVTATVAGEDPLGYTWTSNSSATVTVTSFRLYLPMVTRNSAPHGRAKLAGPRAR